MLQFEVFLFPVLTLPCCVPQDAFGHPGSEMRIGELRPSMPETPLYPPKLILLGKDKKGTAGFTAFEMKPCDGDVPPLLVNHSPWASVHVSTQPADSLNLKMCFSGVWFPSAAP